MVALTGAGNVALLAEQARALGARLAVTADPERLDELAAALAGSGIEAAAGREALVAAAAEPVDWAMSAIVGAAGLEPSLRLARHGGVLALANKESLVCAGDLLRRTCDAHGTRLIPVDSEHSAIFQALNGERVAEVERLILTASGGPFRDWSTGRMAAVTPAQARAHPNWAMGERISIDSATMFNKALEVIEARALFDVNPERDRGAGASAVDRAFLGGVPRRLGDRAARPDGHARRDRLRAQLAGAAGAGGGAAATSPRSAGWTSRRPIRSGFRRCGWRGRCWRRAGWPARCSTRRRRRRSTPSWPGGSAFLTWRCSWNMCWKNSDPRRRPSAPATTSTR